MTTTPSASFDRIARAYRWLEYFSFGRALERCRCLQLGRLLPARHTLVLGDGDGRFLATLLTSCPDLHAVAVDSSPAMLALLAERVKAAGASTRVEVLEGDALQLLEQPPASIDGDAAPPPVELLASSFAAKSSPASNPSARSFDSVCTHFFLDCLSSAEVRRLVSAISPRLTRDAIWIVSEFATPSWWTRLVVALLYRAFAVLTGLEALELPAWRLALEEQGFICLAEQHQLAGLLSSTVWQRKGRDKRQ